MRAATSPSSPAPGNYFYRGSESDGTTLWFVTSDGTNNLVRAYVAATQARDTARDINLGAGFYQGATSDGTTLWFVDNTNNVVRAYVAATRARDASRDIALGSGIWTGGASDGTTLWFVDAASPPFARAYVGCDPGTRRQPGHQPRQRHLDRRRVGRHDPLVRRLRRRLRSGVCVRPPDG